MTDHRSIIQSSDLTRTLIVSLRRVLESDKTFYVHKFRTN